MSQPGINDLMSLGYLSKAHGIRGELVLVGGAQFSQLAKDTVFLAKPPSVPAKAYPIAKTRIHHGALLVSLEGVSTRNDAEALRGYSVYIEKTKLAPLDDGEIYLCDLPGLSVYITASGDPDSTNGENYLGKISLADSPAGQELWTITTDNGKEILFPAVPEFVVAIDVKNGKALIDPPPGLLDLYLAG